MDPFDQILQNQNLQICVQHNQPIVSYDQINEPQCYKCLIDLLGTTDVEKIQQQFQQTLKNSTQGLDGQRQILRKLQDSLNTYKQNLSSDLDKIIQIVTNEMKNIDQSKEQLKLLCVSNNNLKQCVKELENELVSNQENNKKFRNLITSKLNSFQKKLRSIDELLKLIYVNQNVVVQKVSTTSNVKKIQIKEISQQQIKKFEYQLIKDQSIILEKQCQTFSFNYNNTILLVGAENEIIVYEFNNGNIIKELQRLKKHSDFVTCLYFMKKSNSFVSGSDDNSIIIWSVEQNNKWFRKQKLQDHKHQVNCLLMNKNEDLLISGSDDKQIKFWKKQNDLWSCQENIKLSQIIYAVSFNEAEDKLITCGSSQKIYVIEMKNDQKWSVVQVIETSDRGFRLRFTIGNQFVFQSYCGNCLEVYDYDQGKKQFIKLKQVQIQAQNQNLCFFYFSCQYIKQINILIVKNGEQLNLFKVIQDGNYELIQTIQFSHHCLFGSVTDDGEYLITWDDEQKEIQLRKLIILE